LSDFKRGMEEEGRGRDAAFRQRVSAQQHIKFQAPLMRAMVRMTGVVERAYEPGELARRVEMTFELARVIAARVGGRPIVEVRPEDARHFRADSADAVARAWIDGTELDMESIAGELAEAVRVADAVFEADATPWRKMSTAGRLAQTIVPAAMRIRAEVELYDFRLGVPTALARLAGACAEAANEAVGDLLPEGATYADRTSLYQSLLREFSHDLRMVYGAQARRTVALLRHMAPEDSAAYLREMDPFGECLEHFRHFARQVTQINKTWVEASLAGMDAVAPLAPGPR
jgi:hypothetical protein